MSYCTEGGYFKLRPVFALQFEPVALQPVHQKRKSDVPYKSRFPISWQLGYTAFKKNCNPWGMPTFTAPRWIT